MSATPGQPNPYLRTRILTATPQELRMMLYEGAIKFCRQGRQGLEEKNYEASFNALMRAQKIVLELSTSLDHEVAPELCSNLSALYHYIYTKLVHANVDHEVAAADEAIELLEFQKQTWQMLMEKLTQEQAESAGDNPDAAAPDVANAQQTAISSFSARG